MGGWQNVVSFFLLVFCFSISIFVVCLFFFFLYYFAVSVVALLLLLRLLLLLFVLLLFIMLLLLQVEKAEDTCVRDKLHKFASLQLGLTWLEIQIQYE